MPDHVQRRIAAVLAAGAPKPKKPSATYGELAVLASSVGLVSNDEAGRSAFVAWCGSDLPGARKALFTRVAARRAAATAAAARAASAAESTRYPSGWSRHLGSADVVSSAGRSPSAPILRAGRRPVVIKDLND